MKISANDSKKIDDILKQQIIDYLLENPIDRGTPGCYSDVAQQFKVLPEQIRRIYRTLREQGLVEGDSVPTGTADRAFKENVRTGEADVSVVTKKRIKTLSDLLEACEVDENEWSVLSWECTKWEVGRKDKSLDWVVKDGVVIKGDAKDSGKIFVEPLFRVKAKLSRRTVVTDLGKQKDLILAELKNYSPKVGYRVCTDELTTERNQLLEICIFDPHFGKLAWREETDEDYDLKIAEKRVKEAVRELLKRVNLAYISKILLPIGNDLVNIDNRQNTTFAGTPQDTDVRYMKIIRAVKRILIELIDELSQIADVDVVIVPGNHDTTTSFMIGEILSAFYHNNQLVKIDNTPKLRKYYQFGKNGFQFTHGNEEKHESLGLIFATEQPKLWADVKYRFCQLGHFHKNKKLWFTSVDEHQGFQIQVLPSLSGTDFWHKSKGYQSMKQAKAMQYDPVQGLVGEFTTTAV